MSRNKYKQPKKNMNLKKLKNLKKSLMYYTTDI